VACFRTLATAIAPKITVNNKRRNPAGSAVGWVSVKQIALPVGESMADVLHLSS